jgi:hypothetical protein
MLALIGVVGGALSCVRQTGLGHSWLCGHKMGILCAVHPFVQCREHGRKKSHCQVKELTNLQCAMSHRLAHTTPTKNYFARRLMDAPVENVDAIVQAAAAHVIVSDIAVPDVLARTQQKLLP